MARARYELTTYATRIDQFRAAKKLPLSTWSAQAGVPRTQLYSYRRAFHEPSTPTLAALVRAARQLLHEPVRAADLYDLGEDEPLGIRPKRRRPSVVRQMFETPLDRLMIAEDIGAEALATEAAISRQELRLLRRGVEPRVSTLAKLVRGLRRMGVDVRAQDLFDAGDD